MCLGPAGAQCHMARKPNLLITGTPGTGKTTTCQQLAAASGLEHVDVGKLVRRALRCGSAFMHLLRRSNYPG